MAIHCGSTGSDRHGLSLLPASVQVVGVNAHALCRRQVVDSPPAHLQETERNDQYPE